MGTVKRNPCGTSKESYNQLNINNIEGVLPKVKFIRGVLKEISPDQLNSLNNKGNFNKYKEGVENIKDSIAKINKINNMNTSNDKKVIITKKLISLCEDPKNVNLRKVLEDNNEGYLEKQSKAMFAGWKVKYCKIGRAHV